MQRKKRRKTGVFSGWLLHEFECQSGCPASTIYYREIEVRAGTAEADTGTENPEAEKTEYGTLTGACRFLSENVECLFVFSEKGKDTGQNRVSFFYLDKCDPNGVIENLDLFHMHSIDFCIKKSDNLDCD